VDDTTRQVKLSWSSSGPTDVYYIDGAYDDSAFVGGTVIQGVAGGVWIDTSAPTVQQRYYRVAGSGKTLLALENGDPLLVEEDWGRGRVFLFASSADLDWNDLPLNAAFLPLIQGLVKESVGLSESPLPPTLRIGDAFSGTGPPAQIAGTPGGPGILQFSAASGEAWQGVNPPVEESDLRKMTAEEMKKRLVSMEVRVIESREGNGGTPLAGRRDLWPYILGFLLAVLGIEMGVAGRI